MKKAGGKSNDELRPEYKRADFSTLVRSKHAGLELLRGRKRAARRTARTTRRGRRAG